MATQLPSRRKKDNATKIKEEDEALNHRLARESRFTTLAKNLSATADIVKIQEEANVYLRKIETERAKIVELDQEIATTQAKIIDQRRNMGGHDASKNNHDLISRQIRLFENRLDKALAKFNDSLSRNKNLRENIDSLRRERIVFDGVYKKLERELHERKQEMAAIIEDSKNAYQARDELATQLDGLKELSEREQLEFDREWEKFGKALEEEICMRETMGRLAPSDMPIPANPFFDRPSTVGSVPRSAAGGTKSSQRPDNVPTSFEESVERLKESTGHDSLESMIQVFMDTEDKNFRLFSFVNGLSSEVERYELMIAQTKTEMEDFKGHGLSEDSQKRRELDELSVKLERTVAKANEHQTKFHEANETINDLKASIQSMYSRLGAHRNNASGDEGIDEFLGTQGVTEMSMLQYLGVIEQKTTELLQAYCESRDAERDIDIMGGMADVARDDDSSAEGIVVVPPGWDDISDHGQDSDEDDNERPLTRDELHRRAIKNTTTPLVNTTKSPTNRMSFTNKT
jgi:coiled-coil domain-containing protein 63/114